ncbi:MULTISPECIES: LysR family transcriptional regulator [unclassified Colwellia]|uniref:LysR family transcriptional regulator n=1 Tax=unclassified Colwellia TaxID=196834 RepID=UPI0015F670D2|nr:MULTISPECIES: LysR family transcriptional regulator [unclassified Colwellia]MBA6232629.1 LysR family transcriptional regulator [Colwellia sp. MB02u-7]MBA6235230.1 LysR family transcriptional regulator [Colwellia sp. MB02u-11]MBA6257948.1 LysR family transcriptional regulator [Colwellia sp. MB3u-28]MBA6258372.1 LysR family transcriptional regulator [Colwellia sp. MB3u-41]MBA6299280.1 LysR family transcriptional regulator [Colwellia sp. MB3u-22]
MINLAWLKTFCTLADVGHFTQTAEILFMTQSGVSQHIKKLEAQLDTLLLTREGKSFSLTDPGIKLRQRGEILLKTSADIEASIKQDDAFIGIIKVSTPGSVGLKLYPYMLDIQQHYPALVIDYTFAPNKRIEQDLIERKIDLGILTELSRSPLLLNEKIAIEPLVLVTPSRVKRVNWQVLTSLGFISHPDSAHHAQQLLSKNYSEFEHTSQFDHKGFSNQISLILEPVSRGLGFTVLPLHAVNAFPDQNKINIHYLKVPVNETLYLCQNRHSFETKRRRYIKKSIHEFIA